MSKTLVLVFNSSPFTTHDIHLHLISCLLSCCNFSCLIILIPYTFMCICTCVPVYLNLYRSVDQRRTSDLQLKLQITVGCLKWVLGTSPRSSTRTRALNHLVISPVLMLVRFGLCYYYQVACASISHLSF